MADGTHIEWTDATVNAVNGCSVVSPGCTNCYAMRLAGTRLRHQPSRAGLTFDTKAGPVWTGEVRLNEQAMLEPLRWKRPRMIFWNAHGDLFHPNVPVEWVDRQFAVMALTPHHIHQILTKRPDRMRQYLSDDGLIGGRAMQVAIELMGPLAESTPEGETRLWDLQQRLQEKLPPLSSRWPLPNVWLGVSIEDQRRADERREAFAAAPGVIKFVSYEPALGPVDWTGWDFVQQIIAGGESGPGARPHHPDWYRATRDFCLPRSIAFFFKQWGAWAPCESNQGYWPDDGPGFCRILPDGRRGDPSGWPMQRVGKRAAGRLLDGVEHSGLPLPEPFHQAKELTQ